MSKGQEMIAQFSEKTGISADSSGRKAKFFSKGKWGQHFRINREQKRWNSKLLADEYDGLVIVDDEAFVQFSPSAIFEEDLTSNLVAEETQEAVAYRLSPTATMFAQKETQGGFVGGKMYMPLTNLVWRECAGASRDI